MNSFGVLRRHPDHQGGGPLGVKVDEGDLEGLFGGQGSVGEDQALVVAVGSHS